MNGRLFGACFSVFRHKNGAIAPVDYLSTFATAPSDTVSLLVDFRQFSLTLGI